MKLDEFTIKRIQKLSTTCTTQEIARRFDIGIMTVRKYISEFDPSYYSNRAKYIRCATLHFTDPNGTNHTTSNLVKFCDKFNLTYESMSRLRRGLYKQHKGWRLGHDRGVYTPQYTRNRRKDVIS